MIKSMKTGPYWFNEYLKERIQYCGIPPPTRPDTTIEPGGDVTQKQKKYANPRRSLPHGTYGTKLCHSLLVIHINKNIPHLWRWLRVGGSQFKLMGDVRALTPSSNTHLREGKGTGWKERAKDIFLGVTRGGIRTKHLLKHFQLNKI